MARRYRREHNERMSLAWHTAALTRAKKLPKLDTLLAKERKRVRRQMWHEQLAIARQWDAAINRRRDK